MTSPHLTRLALVAGAIAGTASVARAEPSSRVPGTDLVVSVHGSELIVRDKTRRAPFPVRRWGHVELIVDVDASAKGDDVALHVSYNCGGDDTIKTTTQALRARLENAAALALHAKARWDDAGAGFARALALDPSFELAATNLASAQARGGHGKEAVATLVALAQRDLPLVIWRSFADADLASVTSAPELLALEATATDAGTATHATAVSYSASHHLIAWRGTGGDPSGADYYEVEIIDATTGAPIVVMPSTRATDPEIDKTLAALGFAPVPVQRIATGDYSYTDAKAKLIFTGTKIGVVLRAGHVTVLTGDHVLGEGTVGGASRYDAALTPDGVLVVSEELISEGCGGESFDVADLIPVHVSGGTGATR